METQMVRRITRLIRRRREVLQYSQEYMAFKLGMGQNCYSKIELGNSKLTVARFLTICELLELSPGDLLSEKDNDEFLYTYQKQA